MIWEQKIKQIIKKELSNIVSLIHRSQDKEYLKQNLPFLLMSIINKMIH